MREKCGVFGVHGSGLEATASRSVEETRRWIGADSLAYLSYERMIEATGWPADRFSTACFNGSYPVEIAE